MNERIEKTLKALEQNKIDAFLVKDKKEACSKVKEMLFEGATICAGGSMSLKESGVWDIINSPEYNFLDRNKEGLTEEDRLNVFKSVIGCDFYFCSTNALTENGELINIDGFANRVSAIAFGPKKIIMVVGVNKLVKDVEEGVLRVKKVAAPKNAVRLHTGTPCEKLGHCISLLKNPSPSMTDGCKHERRICVEYLITALQREKGRITVILCEEELGY